MVSAGAVSTGAVSPGAVVLAGGAVPGTGNGGRLEVMITGVKDSIGHVVTVKVVIVVGVVVTIGEHFCKEHLVTVTSVIVSQIIVTVAVVVLL